MNPPDKPSVVCSGGGGPIGDGATFYAAGYHRPSLTTSSKLCATSSSSGKEVSFLEFVEVSTTDSSLSPDLTNSVSLSVGVPLTATATLSPSRPPLPNVHTFHYEPLRPPAAIQHPTSASASTTQLSHYPQCHPPPPVVHSCSLSSSNSTSSNSPSPLVSIPESSLLPPYSEGYTHLLLSPRPSLTPSASTSFSIYQSSDASNHHLFPPTSVSPQQLIQFSNSFYDQATFPPTQPSGTSAYETLAGVGPYLPGPHHHQLPTAPPDGNQLLLHDSAVISKSSSSDSDTADSGTRLISDSLADISNQHIFLMSQAASVIANPDAKQYGSSAGPSSVPLNLDPGSVNSAPSPGEPPTDYKSDVLWIQMQSEISKEMREKYLSVNGTGSISSGPSNDSSKASKAKAKKKKSFTFHRIGCGRYGFLCPLRQSTLRCLSLVLLLFIFIFGSLGLWFAYSRHWWIFARSNSRPYGPDPDQYWWQGTTFYEIFPASFKDTDGDGFGDLEGVVEQVAYLRSLGVSAVRLSSVFSALDYPQRFDNVLNFYTVDPHLGRFQDFIKLVRSNKLI